MCFSKNDFHYVFWCILLENICPCLHTSNCFYYQLRLSRTTTLYLGRPCWSFEMWRKVTVYKICVLKKTHLRCRIPTIWVSGPPITFRIDGRRQAGFLLFYPFLSPRSFLSVSSVYLPLSLHLTYFLGFGNWEYCVSERNILLGFTWSDTVQKFIIYPVFVFQTETKVQTNYWYTYALAMDKVGQL